MSAPSRPAPTLAAVLAADAALLAALGVARAAGGPLAARLLAGEPGVRAVGVVLVALAWATLQFARARAVGAKRLLVRVAGAGLGLAGAFHLTGAALLEVLDARLPGAAWPGARALAGAAALGALAVYAWRSSPLRRRVTAPGA